MKIIITISFLLIASLCAAQTQDSKALQTDKNRNEVFKAIQVKAEPAYDLSAYWNNNLHYPKAAQQAEIQGRVVIEFIVEKDGSISGVRAVRGKELGNGLPEEAIRVVKNMPPWKPAMQNGQLVRSYRTLPIDFKLDDPVLLDSRYQFPVDKSVTLIQGAFPSFSYQAYIQKNKVYPSKAIEKKIEGLVAIQFIVEVDSSISAITILKGKDLGYGLPEEALRLIRNMPAWKSALDNNKKPVRSYVIVPVVFELKDK